MQPTELTPHGVDKLLNGEIAIIQIIDSKRVIKQTRGQEITFMVASLSDGYCYLENVFFNCNFFDEAKMENSVVSMSLFEASVKKHKKNPKEGAMMIADAKNYLLILDNIKRKIGCPMAYGEYLKNEKNNPKGSNMIFEKK